MTNLFAYGPQQYLPLLEAVLGRPAASLDVEAATLAGHGVFEAEGGRVPALAPCASKSVGGILIRGLLASDLDALDFHDSGINHDLRQMDVLLDGDHPVSATVRVPRLRPGASREPWCLEDWIARFGALSVRAAEEIMSYQGRLSTEDMAWRIPSLRIRAAAWVAAQNREADPAWDLDRDVIVHSHKRSYLSFFGMEEMDLQFRRYDGTLSPVLGRSVNLVGQAVVVLPYDPVRDTVLLVEQFRAATFIAGNRSPWMWEPVAGLVDPGETPLQAAHREVMEESGVTVQSLEPMAQVYSSSGSSGEFLNIYLGLADLGQVSGGGGVDSEGEDIRSRIVSYDALMQAVDDQVYQDMPLVTAALWLARHRDRLRAQAGAGKPPG